MDVSLIIKIAGVGMLIAVTYQILQRAGRDEQAMMLSRASAHRRRNRHCLRQNTRYFRHMTKINLLEFCGIGIYAAFAVLVTKELRREVSQAVSFGIFAVMLCLCIPIIGELVSFALSLSDKVNEECRDSIGVILKALGITYITYISSEICKNAGENSIASQVEFMGRMEIMLLCLPFFEKILSFALL